MIVESIASTRARPFALALAFEGRPCKLRDALRCGQKERRELQEAVPASLRAHALVLTWGQLRDRLGDCSMMVREGLGQKERGIARGLPVSKKWLPTA